MVRIGGLVLALAVAVALTAAAPAGAAPATQLLESAQAADLVRVEDVRVEGATLRGRLVNATGTELRNVRLLVRHAFLWHDEYHPGVDNPGHAETIELRSAIPPGGTLVFAEPIAPLPARADGSFTTDVTVVAFTQVGTAGRAPSLRSDARRDLRAAE